jgi:hypothetical protein
MAKVLTSDELKALKKFDLPKGYQRTNQFPLDPSSLFASKDDAALYAAGGADSRGLGGTSYAGQIVSVVENGGVALYVIDTTGALQAVGGDVAADLTNLTSKVNAILEGADEGLDTFKEVKEKFDNLKDLVVESGEVRKPTDEEKTADTTLEDAEYIVLTIKNSGEKIFIKANSLVDEYKLDTDSVTTTLLSLTDRTLTVDESGFQSLWNTALTESDYALTRALANEEYAPKSIVETVNTHSTTLTGLEAKVNANETNITTLTTTVGDDTTGLVKQVNDLVADVANIKVKDVDTTASNGVNLTLSEEGKVGVNVDVDTLAAKVNAKLGTTVSADNVITPEDIVSKMDGPITEIADGGGTLTTALQYINRNIESVYTELKSADNSISVSDRVNKDGNTPGYYTIGLKVADDTNLQIGDNGLEFVWLD